MTKNEVIEYVRSEINSRGMTAADPEVEPGFAVVRIKSGEIVCGSVTITDADVSTGDAAALQARVLEALRAAVKEPILRV